MGAALSTATRVQPETPHAGAAALRAQLDELMRLLMTLPRDVYTAKVAASSGTIGSHVRHILDHVATLIASRGCSELTYDRRARGTPVEVDPAAAIRESLRLAGALDRWDDDTLDDLLPVSAMVARDHSVTGWSSRARELAFVVSHTIHHQAIIALLLEMQGIGVGSGDFGYSPSTPRT